MTLEKKFNYSDYNWKSQVDVSALVWQISESSLPDELDNLFYLEYRVKLNNANARDPQRSRRHMTHKPYKHDGRRPPFLKSEANMEVTNMQYHWRPLGLLLQKKLATIHFHEFSILYSFN